MFGPLDIDWPNGGRADNGWMDRQEQARREEHARWAEWIDSLPDAPQQKPQRVHWSFSDVVRYKALPLFFAVLIVYACLLVPFGFVDQALDALINAQTGAEGFYFELPFRIGGLLRGATSLVLTPIILKAMLNHAEKPVPSGASEGKARKGLPRAAAVIFVFCFMMFCIAAEPGAM